MKRARLITTLVAAVVTALAFASATYAGDKKIKYVSAPNADPGSGVEMYRAYCASCHGMEGKGNGPAASALKQPVPDLTTLATRNGGQYPDLQVALVIKGDSSITSHGSSSMPVWGPIFRSIKDDDNIIALRIRNLTSYVSTLQQK